jgi:hypothetical protein
MSRANITSMLSTELGLLVTFQVHGGGETTRTYLFDPIAGEQILAGADPKDFQGTLVDSN